jgi:hypothetical protein
MNVLITIALLLMTASQPAVIDVRDYGAIPDDGKDDTFAIQSAIEAARDGQIVRFPPGTFEISRQINPRGSGRTIEGATQLIWQGDRVVAQSETILKAKGNKSIFYFRGLDLTLRNLTFDGRALFCDRDNNAMVENVVIDNCWFRGELTGDANNAIEFTTGLKDSKITNCVFDPIHADNAIYGYNWNNLLIANNLFLDGNEGIHLIAHYDPSKDLLIEQNYFAGLHRMGIECQGGGSNTIVQDNFYEKPMMTKNFHDNDSTFAYSIVADRSRSSIIRRNTALAPEKPDGTGVRILFELGGHGFRCLDNYTVGGQNVVSVNGANATGTVHHNRFRDFQNPPTNFNGAGALILDNSPDAKLTWDVNRGKPGPNKRLAAGK